MITSQILLERFKVRERKTQLAALAQTLFAEQFPLSELVDLTFHKDTEIGFRAAWLLELVFVILPQAYIGDFAYIVKRFPEITNDSCRRHFCKILITICNSKAPDVVKNQLDLLDMEAVVETLFEWMINPEGKIAVKVFSSDLLLQLSSRYQWIKEELTEQVKFMMRDGSAGIQARSRKILQQLEKQKHLQR